MATNNEPTMGGKDAQAKYHEEALAEMRARSKAAQLGNLSDSQLAGLARAMLEMNSDPDYNFTIHPTNMTLIRYAASDDDSGMAPQLGGKTDE